MHDEHHYVREVAAIASQFVTHRSQRSFEDITAALIDGMEDGNLETRSLNAAALVHLINNRKVDQNEAHRLSKRKGQGTATSERADDNVDATKNNNSIDDKGVARLVERG